MEVVSFSLTIRRHPLEEELLIFKQLPSMYGNQQSKPMGSQVLMEGEEEQEALLSLNTKLYQEIQILAQMGDQGKAQEGEEGFGYGITTGNFKNSTQATIGSK